MTDDVVQQLRRSRLVPVIELEDPTAAPALGAALVAGGLPCAEVTFRTAGAADAIRRLRDAHPAVLVGAGTVLNAAQVDAAVDAGAAFLVAPGLNPATVARAQERGVPMLPGVCTPSEIERAMTLGLTTLKFFPAEVAGGPAFLKAVAAVYRSVGFVPTGGISAANLGTYLVLPNVLACGGSWMVRRDLLSAGAFDQVEAQVWDAVRLVASLDAEGAIR